jgi:hypothetical protein
MESTRFTITVLENRVNEDRQFLPGVFVVSTWDLKTDALKRSEAHTNHWKRVDKFDLPAELLVVSAEGGKQEARSLRLSRHELLTGK